MKLSHKNKIKNNYEAQSLTKQVMENAKKKTHFKNTTQEKD
jgi:hypothetical protein